MAHSSGSNYERSWMWKVNTKLCLCLTSALWKWCTETWR